MLAICPGAVPLKVRLFATDVFKEYGIITFSCVSSDELDQSLEDNINYFITYMVLVKIS